MKNSIPLSELFPNKTKLRWAETHYCSHRHPFSDHAPCYIREIGGFKEERIGFIDIETEDLRADYGCVFCWCIKPIGDNRIQSDIVNVSDIRKWGKEAKEDTRILRSLVEAMRGYDRLIGHYSSCFDLSFLRTRAVICGVDFPEYGVYVQSDTWRILRSKFRLSRNSLQNASEKLLGRTEKNHLSLALKHGCLRGDKKALAYTLDHCRRDVRDTERLYGVISKFVKNTKSSI